MYKAVASILLTLSAVCSGCSMQMTLPEADIPVPDQSLYARIPLSVGIAAHDASELKESLWVNPQLASNTITVSIPAGKILNKYAYAIGNNVFERVLLLNNNPTEGGSADAILSTEITDIKQDWPPTQGLSGTYQFTTSVQAILTDRNGVRIWQKTVTPSKPSQGNWSGMSVDEKEMARVATESVITALQTIATDIRASRDIHAFADSKNAPKVQQAGAWPLTTQRPAKEMPAAPPADSDRSIPTGTPAGRYDIAVVIGNANYVAADTPGVDYALHDAQVMRAYLIKAFGYDPANIIYIENATLAKMYEVFGTDSDYHGKLFKWVKPGQSKVFIYYAGHGAPDQRTGEGYFVPVDANPQYISTSGYKLSTFYENLSKIPAVKKTVVIDACFSGSSAHGQLIKGVSGLTARLKSEPTAATATDLLFTSAGMDQVADWYPEKGHSLFTYFFLKGIQGEADTNKDGKITMGEMRTWLNDQVPYMARRLKGNEQQPVMMGKDSDELVVLTR